MNRNTTLVRPEQFREGPELLITQDVTHETIARLLQLLRASFGPRYVINANDSSEGGIQIFSGPEHTGGGEKSMRMFVYSRHHVTDKLNPDGTGRMIQLYSATAKRNDVRNPNYVRCFLKARSNAPWWTVEEVRLVEQALEQTGSFQVVGKRVSRRSLAA